VKQTSKILSKNIVSDISVVKCTEDPGAGVRARGLARAEARARVRVRVRMRVRMRVRVRTRVRMRVREGLLNKQAEFCVKI